MNPEAQWYGNLIKPEWSPPGWLFGPVWSVLYLIIAVTFFAVAWQYWKGNLRFVILLPFILNIAFNLAFSPIQFVLKNNVLAAIDIALVLATLVWALVAIRSQMPWVAYANLPYLFWVCFATVLQFSITWLNR